MSERNVFIARQPILDKEQKTFAYELFSRGSENAEASEGSHSAASDSEMLFNILSTFGIEQLLDGKQAFLNCVLEDNSLDYFELISPKNVTLEIAPASNLEGIEEIAEKIEILKAKGYSFAAGDFVLSEEYSKWLQFMTLVKLDGSTTDYKALAEKVKKCRLLGKKLVAERVETVEQFQLLNKFGFDYYQGYFFSKPVNMGAKITNPSTTTLIRLINLTLQEADLKEIESVLKTDPTLSFKLLRYMNSYGVGGGIKIDSFQHALMVLGYKKLFKWLTILFTTTKQSPGSDALAKMALVRGKFMELIAADYLKKQDADQCFVVGLFSLLDAMLNVPVEVAMNSINVPDSIRDPILQKSGDYWPVLNLAVSLEQNDWIEVFAIAYTLKLSSTLINERYLQAIEWTNQLDI